MCGRFTISSTVEELNQYLQDEYSISTPIKELVLPRYNIAPGQNVISVLHDNYNYRAGLIKWGFIPFFAKPDHSDTGIMNAKAETLHERRAFSHSLKHKRCVILANGFYEWKRENNKKVPMRILNVDQSIFSMAGIWSTTIMADGSKLHTCAIITTSANKFISSIHDRMPVILNKDQRNLWLDMTITDTDILQSLLISRDYESMKAYQVSSIVNKSSNEVIDCIYEVK